MEGPVLDYTFGLLKHSVVPAEYTLSPPITREVLTYMAWIGLLITVLSTIDISCATSHLLRCYSASPG